MPFFVKIALAVILAIWVLDEIRVSLIIANAPSYSPYRRNLYGRISYVACFICSAFFVSYLIFG